MKVSIITPTLNSEKYILNNLESVHLRQSGKFTIEQIIVDGNSTDGTIDIIESFMQKYGANIKIIVGKDKNMYDAINKGMNYISGDIWACLNSDDYYNPNIINVINRQFKKNSDLDVVYGYMDIINKKGTFLRQSILPKFKFDYLILSKYCINIKQPAVFLKKNVIQKVGYFDINYKYASDYDYFIRVASRCKMKLIPQTITHFRDHEESISTNNKTRTLQCSESEHISNKYINDFQLKQRMLYLDNIKFYLIQIKLKNIRFIIQRLLFKFF